MAIITAESMTGSEPEMLTGLFREASSITEPAELLAHFGRWFGGQRRSDLFLSTSRRGLPDGQFKITRWMPGDTRDARNAQPPPNPWRDWGSFPVLSGGLLGEVMGTGGPCLLKDLDTAGDPHLREFAGRIRSGIAIATYSQGQALNWAFWLFEDAAPPIEDQFRDMIVQTSFLGLATRNLVATKELNLLNAKLRGQLEQVAMIQKSLLPQMLPDIPGLDVATSYLTSDEAGGDYYDFFRFPDGRWGILIADVAGHGPGAATVMAMLRAILHCYERDDLCPSTIMRYANARLMDARLEGSFVTAFFAVYDPSQGTLDWVRCGHNPPRLKRGDTGEVVELSDAGGLPLGVLDDLDITPARTVLRPGDTVVLYTDGITEAFDADHQMFGTSGLDAALERCSGNPECVVDSVHGALYEHTGVMDRDDDQTLVALRYQPGLRAPTLNGAPVAAVR